MHWTLTPAYGRDYRTADDAVADFDADKDFVCEATPDGPNFGGRYVSKNQVPKGNVVYIRYKKNTRVAVTTRR